MVRDTMSRPLAVIRRSTRCLGRPMSILSGTLTRYYTRATENSHFCPLFLWRNETSRARAQFRTGHRIFAARHHEIAHVLVRDLSHHPVPLYPAITSIDLPGTNRSLSPRRTVHFLVMLCDTREIISIHTNTQSGSQRNVFSPRRHGFLPHSHFSFTLFLGKHKPAWTNDTRDDKRTGERGFSAPRL